MPSSTNFSASVSDEKRRETAHMRQEGSSDTTSSTTTMPTSSSSNTNPPSARMENGVKIPVLAVGTYHRKPAAPILSVAELAALPKPTSDERNFASRSEGESNSSEMRGPPPAWQPPRPPGKAPDHDYTNDYEDPEDMAKQRDLSRDLLLKTTSAFNSYEMSLSQQRRSAEASSRELMAPPMESWSAEPAVLHKNSDGAYYIPSGSLRTTSSTLSPTSVTTGTTTRYHEPPHALGAPSTFSDASATLLKYPNTTVSVTQARRRQVKMPSVEKKDKPVYRKFSLCSILLCISLLLALLVISLLLLRAPSYVYTEPSPSAVGDSVSRYQDLGLRALPSMISLGEQIHADFLPKHMANTELFIARSARVAFNVTVGSGAQLVLLTRAGAPPSLSLHDELFSLRADRMGVERNPTHQIEEKRSKRSVSAPLPHYQILSPRSGTFEQFMLEGRHFLMFINERNRVEPLAFVAAVTTPSPSSRQHKSGEGTAATTTACESNCNNRGECVDGKCKCVGGYTGDACEEAICPVVCSGNGVFSGGVCVCRAGFKGKECDVRSNWCEVPDCNGRGVCGDEGKCRCEFGWTGDSCEKKACTHPTCNDRGVCVNGTCYCLDGWQGVDCHTFVDVTVRKEASETTEAPRKAQSENAVKKSNKPEAAAFDSTRKKEDPPVKTPFSSSTFNESVQLSIEKDCVDEDCVCDSFEKCSAVVCSGCANGHCDEAGVCYCWKGWTGTACDVEMCSVGCSDHGKCRDDGTCECDKGWNGDNCFEQGCPNDCSQRGECTRKIGERWSCDCQVGRRGDDCAIPVELHCDDGLDNDNDGFVDCDDPECCESESCATESVCSTSPSPSEVLLRMPPVLNAHFDQRINFLIKEKSVQVYTDPNQFNETLVSVVRGRVMWNGGSDKETKSKVPLAGVRVWDASHPLYGFTLTRSDGYFDLVVNGGRSIGLQFLRTPFHSVKKNVYVSTHVISHIDDVVIGREKTQTAELPPRAKCTPATRQIGDVVMKSSWQCASDGVVVRTGDEWIGSRLVVDTRSIVEQIPIPGSSLNLVYDSSRVPATNSTLIIGILGVDIDVELRLVHLIIDVAGRHFEFKLAPKVNLTHVFAWDRMNAYRQSEHGVTSVFVRIGFEYRGCSRESEIVWISRRTEMMGATSRKMEGTSWTIDVHHFFDVVNHIVELGNGGVRMLENDEQRVETALGQDEVKRDIDCGEKCGGSAEKVSLFRPTALAFALDGSLIVGDHNLIRRVAPDGTVNTILTLGLADTSHSYYIAVNPVDGTVAISLPLHKQVLKIVSLTPSDPRNNEEVIAGDGTTCASAVDSCGDGGLALNAQLIFNKGVSYDRDGTLYLADSRRIRIVDVSGHIRSIGDASPDSNPGCHFYMRLANLQLEWPTSVSVDPSSNTIYVLDSNIVYEIEPAHDIARIVLGSPTSCTNSSSQIPLRHARDIAVAPDGSLYIVESDAKRINQLRRLSPDRAAISLVAGGVSPCSCDVPTCGCDDSNSLLAVAARNAHLNSPSSVAINAAGVVFLADSANGKVKRVFVRGARYDPHSRTYKVTAGEKNEAYIFNRHGLHLSTVSLLSGKSVLNFTYNIDSSLGKLVSIQGSGGLSLRLLRDNDTHVNIEAPNGESLRLFMSAYDGLLETVQHGVKDSISLNYQGRGLLHSRVDTEKAVVFGYDDFGRARSLRRDGENWELAEEKIIQGRISTQVRLNGVPFADVKIREQDVSVEETRGDTTRLIAMDDGYSLVAMGLTSLLDSQTSPLHDEKALLKRRTTVPALSNPTRRSLTTRWDWRFVAKKNDSRRLAEINGVNMFSMKYDVSQNQDTLYGRNDEPLLIFDYSETGELRRVLDGTSDEDSYRLAEMNVTFDSLGRRSEVQWGKSKIQAAYDSQHRVVERNHEGAFVAQQFRYSKSQRHPSFVEQGGLKHSIKYDNHDRLKEITSPSGEVHTFSCISMGGGEWILKRRYAFANKPILFALDRSGKLKEAVTPDGLHHLVVQRDISSRVLQVFNDEEKTRVTRWRPTGEALCTSSPNYMTNSTLQGPLLAWFSVWKNSSQGVKTSSFSYEYDDLHRPTSIQVVADGIAVEPMKFSYDEKNGRLSALNGFTLLHEPSITRVSGNSILHEIFLDDHRRVVARKWMLGDVRVSLSIQRDSVGRPFASEWRMPNSDVILQSVTFDSFGRLATVENDSKKVTFTYNTDGRVVKVDDLTVEWHSSGVPKKVADTEYSVDENGWVTGRGNATFSYDALGRLVTAQTVMTLFQFQYDHLDRVISISKNDEHTSLLYGNPSSPRQLTHFVTSAGVATLFYDDDDAPFAVSIDGSYYALGIDEHNSLRFVLSEAGVLKVVKRDVLGKVVQDSKPDLWLPIGFLGGIEIAELCVTILDGRPLDNSLGRYLSYSVLSLSRLSFSSLTSSLDLFALEDHRNPYRVPSIPTDMPSWFGLTALSASLLPSETFGLPPDRTTTYRLLSSFPSRLHSFSHLNTILTSPLVDPQSKEMRPSDDVKWSVEDIGFSNLVIVSLNINKTFVNALPTLKEDEVKTLKSIIDGAQMINFRTWVSVQAIHLLSPSSMTSLSSSANSHFTLVASRESAELRSGKTRIVVHFSNDLNAVRKNLVDELRSRESAMVWRAERKRVQNGVISVFPWSDRQKRELLSKGSVTGVDIEMKKSHQIAVFPSSHSWRFISV